MSGRSSAVISRKRSRAVAAGIIGSGCSACDCGDGDRDRRRALDPSGRRPRPYFSALAAAFAACLVARTFVSDSGETMSATERKAPSSP